MHFKGISLIMSIGGDKKMTESAYKRYCAVQKALETDEEYLALEEKRKEQSRQFLALLDSLPEEQRETVTEYIGICTEVNDRIVEIACFTP